jgi:hypothetical protein
MRLIRSRVSVLAALAAAALTATLLGTPSAAQAAETTGPSADGRPTIGLALGKPRIGLAQAAAVEREVWYGHWFPAPVCNGDICSITSLDDLPRFWISGQDFNNGRIYVGIFRRDGTPIKSITINSGVWQGFVAYAWGWKADMIDCAAIGAPITDNSFIQAKDLTNNLWSNRIFVTTGCPVL